MKKLILTIVCLTALFGTVKAEEDYLPFVVEGKVWNVTNSHFLDDWFGQFYIKGDTVINNVECKKMYSYNVWDNNQKTQYEAALFEKDKKVYQMHSTGLGLLYDFNIPVGDTIYRYNSKSKEYVGFMKVVGKEKNYYRGNPQSYIVMYDIEPFNNPYNSTSEDRYGYWIEGVGTLKEPLDNYTGYLLGGNIRLSNCVVNGDTIYSYTDNFKYEEALSKKYATGISTVKAGAKARAESWYDLQGRPVTRPEKGRIYIHDGRKIVR